MLRPSKTTGVLSLLAFSSRAIAAQPLIIPFSGSFGPDGPWHALTTSLGNNSQAIHLYPAVKAWASVVFGKDICNSFSKQSDCPTSDGGLYNGENTNEVNGIRYQERGSDGFTSSLTLTPNLLSANTSKWSEHIGVDLELGGEGATKIKVEQANFLRVDSCTYKLPGLGGNTYEPDLGWLSMGGPDPDQHFADTTTGKVITNPIPLKWMASQRKIPSAAWGMHIGSVEHSIEGSCVWGGYDASRIAGPVATFPQYVKEAGKDKERFFQFQLNDIFIGVAAGTNPLGYADDGMKTLGYADGMKRGLLKSDTAGVNEFAGTGEKVTVHLHSEVPYLYLPRATCDAIAAELPVSYNSDYGLYIWDNSSTTYQNLIGSPAYLGFNFTYDTPAWFSINVPFALLHLDLTYPIAPKGQKLTYFPCRPYELPREDAPEYASYVLGRAFLQAAFIGHSWETSKYWMAQAPGPNGPASNVVPLSNSAIALDVKVDEDAWVKSWASTWKVNTTEIPGATPPTTTADDKEGGTAKAKSNTGAIAGGVVGGLAALAAGAAFAFFRRSRKDKPGNTPGKGAAAGVDEKQNPANLPIPYDSEAHLHHHPAHAHSGGGYAQVPQNYHNVPHSAELEGSPRAELHSDEGDSHLSPIPMPPPPPAQELEASMPSRPSTDSLKK